MMRMAEYCAKLLLTLTLSKLFAASSSIVSDVIVAMLSTISLTAQFINKSYGIKLVYKLLLFKMCEWMLSIVNRKSARICNTRGVNLEVVVAA